MAEPWLSAADIEKGAKWNQVVNGELEQSNFAIICLTPENLGAPWLLFEAGSLSKRAESRVCTFLYEIEYSEVKDPLSQFQHTRANEVETKKMVETINRYLGDAALPKDRLDKAFDKWWPDLKSSLDGVLAPDLKTVSHERNVPGMISEILERVREQGREMERLRRSLEPVFSAEFPGSDLIPTPIRRPDSPPQPVGEPAVRPRPVGSRPASRPIYPPKPPSRPVSSAPPPSDDADGPHEDIRDDDIPF
jgi:hypothetical protein